MPNQGVVGGFTVEEASPYTGVIRQNASIASDFSSPLRGHMTISWRLKNKTGQLFVSVCELISLL